MMVVPLTKNIFNTAELYITLKRMNFIELHFKIYFKNLKDHSMKKH